MDQSEKPKSEEEKEAEEMNEGDEERNEELTSQCEEVKFLNELETQIQTFPAMNDIISCIIDPLSDVSKDVVVQKFNKKLLNWLKENINRVISIAVKYEKHNVVNFLVECGVNVNKTDDNGHTAANYAYVKKNYKILLLLLQADSFFPAGFNLNEINYDEDVANEIKNFVYQRNKLHETIKDGEVEDVKNLTLVENSTLYLNINNESAAYNALKHQKFNTYAFLKSIGAEFANIGEEKIIDTFELKENVILQEAMVEYFPAAPDAHIHYLISKSRSQKPIKGLTSKLQYYYKKLNEYREISLILKVVQYADYLDIIFDFDEEDVSKVRPLTSKKDCRRGETEYKVGRIYVAAGLRKRKAEEILGTIAHELTHMALQMLFGNNCNPYRESDKETVDFFQNLKRQVCTQREILMGSGEPSKILMNAIDKYDDVDHHSELTVLVPHIVAQFEEGRDWLEKNVSEIYHFYKETILTKCEDFIKESVILKPKNIIKSINEKIGEIRKLKKCNVNFNNAKNLFEKTDKKIFLIKVESTLLGMLKVLQRLYGKRYTNFHTQFLALKFSSFVEQLDEVSQAFFMKCCDWLIIEISDIPTGDELGRVCEIISELLQLKEHKKMIFVANQKVIKYLWTTLLNDSKLQDFCEEIPDEHLGLENLDNDSQKRILKKKVFFQGKPISLQKLIQTPELYNLINAKIIETILEEREVTVGNEIMGMSSLEGAYVDILQEIDFPSFVRQVKDSNDIFIVRSKSNYEAVEYFNGKFGKDSVNTDLLTDTTNDLKRDKYQNKIFLVNDSFESKEFKTFCKINFEKKCFLIEEKDLATNCFFLQQFYNPYFYLNRNVKLPSIKVDEAKNVISECISDTFILINVLDNNLYNFMQLSNVKCFIGSDEAEKNFKMLPERGNNVHWFKLDNDSLIWVYSHGSVKNLRDALQKYGDFKVCDEEKFCSDVAQKRILLIADNPGTGKSTTLTKLYEAKPIIDNHWIIRINLKDHLQALREEVNSIDFNSEKIIRLLQKIDSNLKTELNENLLKIMLTSKLNFAKCLLLAFDGFDEILDEDDREHVINVLKFLKNKTHIKIWMTTRVQYKKELEIALNTFAIEIIPFDPEKQKLFIRKYLEVRLNLVLKLEKFDETFNDQQDSKISIFTERLLIKMKEIFKGDLIKFIGVPLQLHLVMSGSVEYFKTWIVNEKKLDFNYLGNNLLDVYQNFIEKKYTVYFKKCNITEKKRQMREKKHSENYNKSLADSLIYKRKALKPEDDDKEIYLLVGLIQLQNDDDFEFIHFTFREYYFAQQYAEYIISKELISKKMEFLFQKILTKPEFQVIRNFLNIRLRETLPETRLEELQSLLISADILKPYTTWGSALAVAAREGLENVSKFICFLYFHKTSKDIPLFNVTDILNQAVFRSAAVEGNSEYYTALWNISRTFSNSRWESFYFKSLLTDIIIFAAEKKKLEFIENILEKIEEWLPKNEIFEFLKLVHNKKYKNSIQNVTEFCDKNMTFSMSSMKFLILILNMGSKCLSQKERKIIFKNHIRKDTFSSALFSASIRKDTKFMESLLNECKVVMKPEDEYRLLKTPRENGETILHVAAEHGSLEATKLILKEIENIGNPEKQAEFIILADNYGSTALYKAVKKNNTHVVNLLIEEGEKLLNKEKFLEYITGYNKMNRKFCPLPYGRRFNESIKFLYEKGKSMLSPEDRSRWLMTSDTFFGNLLHGAIIFNDSEMISFLFEELKYEQINKLLKAKSIEETPARQYFTPAEIVTSEILELLPEIEKFLSSENENESIMTRNAFTLLAQDAVSVIKFLMEKITESLKPEKQLEFFSLNNFSITMFLLKTSPIEIVELQFKQIKKLTGGHHFYTELFNSNNNFFSSIVKNQDDRVAKFILDKMDHVLDRREQRKFLMKTDEYGCTCFHLGTEKNRKKLLKFFFEKAKKILSYCEQCTLLLMKDKEGNTVLHTFTKNERKRLDTDILEWLLEIAEELLPIEEKRKFFTMTNKNNQTCLHVIFNQNVRFYPSKRELTLKLILEKARSVLSSEQIREFLFKKNSFGDTFSLLYFAECDTDPEFLLDIFEKMLKPEDLEMLIMEIWNRLENRNFRENINVEEILVYIDKVFSAEKKQEFFMVTKYLTNQNGSPLIFHILSSDLVITNVGCLLEKLKTEFTPNQQLQFFKMEDNFYGTIFHIVTKFKNFDEIKLVFQEGERMLKQDFPRVFTLQDADNRSILHLAVLYRNYNELDFIINVGNRILKPETQKEILMKADWRDKTVLHLALFNGNLDPIVTYEREEKNEEENFNLVHLLLNEAKRLFTLEEQRQFFMIKDKWGKTAFQYAVETEKVEAIKLLLQVAEKCFAGKDLQTFILDQAIAEGADGFSKKNYMITNLITEFLEEKSKSGHKRHSQKPYPRENKKIKMI